MRFNVPQFVDIEDTILGPLTLKQFFLLIAGGLIFALLWWAFQLWFVLLIGVPMMLVIAAFIFIKPGGRSLTKVFLARFNYWTKPRFYVWKNK